MHRYILLEIGRAAAAAQRKRLTRALEELAAYTGEWPPSVLSTRFNLAQTAVLIEAEFTRGIARNAALLDSVSGALDVTPAALGRALNLTAFEKAEDAAAYLAAHRKEWEPEPPVFLAAPEPVRTDIPRAPKPPRPLRPRKLSNALEDTARG